MFRRDKKITYKRFFPLLLFVFIASFIFFIASFIFFISKDYGMFWDNVLFGSKMGNQLYFNGVFNWYIPDSFDPGHPPVFAFLLAIVWKLFGYSLLVSHLLMLPFIIGVFYQLYRFTNYYVDNHFISYFGLFLILVDPTLSTSFVLVNPELIIIFFFFLTLNGILYEKQEWKFLGLFFLSILTFRSMMLFAGLFLFDVFNNYYFQKKKLKIYLNARFFVFYFLASLPGVIYIFYRLLTKGWLQTHPNSPWTSLWYFASLKRILKNVVVLAWRYVDFGRVFIFIFLIAAVIILKDKVLKNKYIQQLFLISITSVIFIIITVLLSTNFFGHRYFIVSYICFILIAFLILIEIIKKRKIIYSLLFTGLILGNFWVYPKQISQGWDATLAHIPYHALRKEAINYLDKEKIDLRQVGTFFPNSNTLNEIDLNKDMRSFPHFNQKQNYVFYSNVYNLSNIDLNFIDENYIEIKRFSCLKIYVSILKLK